jgi:5-methylcytosine-specific restriction enzyme subunit McrC
VDTPRNRLARAALEKIATTVEDDPIAHRCRSLARDLMRMGVSTGRPSRSEMSRDQIARHDGGDRQMVAASTIALDLVLPSESEGKNRLMRLARDKDLLPRIFQGAITGFYRHELDRGWRVFSEQHLRWPACNATQDLSNILPIMRADIVLENPISNRRLIVDTKFKSIITRYREDDRLRSPDLYQIYAYLRSQTGKGDTMADKAEGVLLYPAISRSLDEAVTIQGHRLRFATVDLSMERHDIHQRLLDIVLMRR